MVEDTNLLIEAAYAGAKRALEDGAVPARFLTTRQASQFLGIAEITLATWRVAHKGPPYIRVGRQIRYCRKDLLAFMSGAAPIPGGPVKVFPGAPIRVEDEDFLK